jgi:Ca-activated chloride channel homolog
VEVKVSHVFRRLSGPVFAGMKVTASSERGIREILPRSLPDIFDGDQVILLGQYTQSEPMKIILAGNYLGEKREFEISLDPASASTRNSYVPRMWATRMVGELLDQIRQASTDGTNAASDPRTKELVDEIVRLSTKWGILTEYTAFLVQEPPGTVTAWRELGRMPARQPMEPATEAPAQLRARVEERAGDRSGTAAVNQEINLYASKTAAAGAGGGKAPAAQVWYNERLERVEAKGAQHVSDKAFLWRNSQWIDSRALAKEQEKPDRVVEFGTPEYDKLVDDLLAQDLQGVLAMVGDVLVVSNGERVLIKMPTDG